MNETTGSKSSSYPILVANQAKIDKLLLEVEAKFDQHRTCIMLEPSILLIECRYSGAAFVAEHRAILEKENTALKAEVQSLRDRLIALETEHGGTVYALFF